MSPSPLHQIVSKDLRAAYDGSADSRNTSERSSWQLAERDAFFARLHEEDVRSMFEVGSGAGHDAQFFADGGYRVVATDLSPRMVEMCRRRGLEAHVMDVLHLRLPPNSFDAGYSMNSLLHVSNADISSALLAIRGPLKQSSLFYLGVYGGQVPFEGILESDWHLPPRFFSFRTDSQLLMEVERYFRVEEFQIVEDDRHFQSLTLRAK